MSRKKKIETWRQVTKVKLNVAGVQNKGIGADIYDTKPFTEGKTYEVIGIVRFSYADRSGAYCYLVQDDTGAIQPRTMNFFEVVEIKETTKQ